MKKIFVLILVLFFLFGCNLTGKSATPSISPTIPLPTATITHSPEPTAIQSAEIINPDNVEKLKHTGTLNLEYPYRLWFSPDSMHAYAASRTLLLGFSIPDMMPSSKLPVDEPTVLLSVSPAANLAALTDHYENIRLVDLQTGQDAHTIQPQGQFSEAFFSEDGASLGVISADEIRVDLFNISDGSLIRQYKGFQTAAPVYNVFPAGEDRTLAWVSRGRLQLMDSAGGQLGPEFSHEDFIAGWALSPDGNLLATSAGGELNGEFTPLIYIWNAVTGQQIISIKVPETPAASLAFTPDGQLMAAAVGSSVRIYRVSDWSLIATLEGPTERISYLAVSPDGRSLLASAGDNLVHLWQVVP